MVPAENRHTAPNGRGGLVAKICIAISGGPCTGKSTLAAALFARLKYDGFDYDLVTEESRKLYSEFGGFKTTFDRFYIWRQQEREELRSIAHDGFITDSPLFHNYVAARLYSTEPRDYMAVRELLRMCHEIEGRYQLIVMAEDPDEIQYKQDRSRSGDERNARKRHALTRSYVEHFLPELLFLVRGSVQDRLEQVVAHLKKMRSA